MARVVVSQVLLSGLLLLLGCCCVSGDLLSSGQLGHLDGALKAASLGGSILGVCGADFVALAAMSPDAEPSSRETLAYPPERLWRVSASSCVAAVGFARDAVLVADLAREECESRRLRFGSEPIPTRLADELADAIAAAARQGRPIGVHTVVAGVGPRGPVLCHVDPAGREARLRAVAVGNNDQRLRDQLITRLSALDGDLDVHQAKAILRDTILAARPPRFLPGHGGAVDSLSLDQERPPPATDLLVITRRTTCDKSKSASSSSSSSSDPPQQVEPLFLGSFREGGRQVSPLERRRGEQPAPDN
mmetsp:Transcript_25551/g.82677  ORF Transcript_25551/g.82677 Transcript_25551/m.82677 type:complete len:305 (+) Transcript_25551:1475-2389(+)|eukprot:CAMPEP_0118894366 /NCGR_PEP_ID=MMETSP1166-20130328/3174_1 /TAXON_ID=1104430 /ORGANISM="Chrysoreinhardia sp, Strain CCMP3193" /LENGTH=304 /DNA_ID=CAMNT_0006833265 /DNA_START=32 /DNA_END=946 /DNA_ORIENTATION=+